MEQETRRLDRPALRCRAHRTNGQPCSAWAIHGATVCRAHGAAAPQVKAAAARRVRDLYPTAVDALEYAATDRNPEVRSPMVRAAHIIVEYADGKPVERIEATVLDLAALIRLARGEQVP